jgi:DNA-binding transcriptional regulator YdaS (Cro superfamily)
MTADIPPGDAPSDSRDDLQAIRSAVDSLGGPSAAARILDCSPQAVIFWMKGERTLPAERAIELEKATGGTWRAEALRPDVEWAVIRATPAGVGAGD